MSGPRPSGAAEAERPVGGPRPLAVAVLAVAVAVAYLSTRLVGLPTYLPTYRTK